MSATVVAPADRTDASPRFLSYLQPYPHEEWHLAASQVNLSAESQPQSESPPAEAQAKKETLFSLDYIKLVGSDIREVFTAPARWDTQDWLIFSGVTAGIVTLGFFDEDIQAAVQRNRNQTLDDIFKGIQPLGAHYSFAVLGGFYLEGEIFHDARSKAVALDGLSASIISGGLIVLPLKYIVGRDRPGVGDGSLDFEPFGPDHSFPSGHTTQAFAVATTIAEHYDSFWVKAATYTLASAVGYARLEQNAHWATDVAAGAAIGTFVGHVVVHYNESHRRVAIMPLVGPGMQAVQLSWSF